MKLVDILARELKVWPEGAISVDNSTVDGEVYAYDGTGYLKSTGVFLSLLPEDPKTEIYRAQWQAAVDELKGESSPAWVGVGHPPVGTWCKMSDSKKTIRAKVLFCGKTIVAVEAETGEEFAAGLKFVKFELDRTPEQIKADERSKACDKMYGVILDSIPQDRRGNGSDICEALYDAGYRKFEIVESDQ